MNRKGFTLIEILIVVVLLGILSAVVIPMYAETNVSACEAAGTDMEKSLNKAAQYYRLKQPGSAWTTLCANGDVDAVVSTLYAAGYTDQEVARIPSGHTLTWNNGTFSVTPD